MRKTLVSRLILTLLLILGLFSLRIELRLFNFVLPFVMLESVIFVVETRLKWIVLLC